MYYFIVNPLARSAKGIKIWQTVEKELNKNNVQYEMYYTSRKGHATELARKISSEQAPCTIVAVGGDGTANEVICGLTNLDKVTFGYIPSGSGNDLARGLGLRTETSVALKAILNPEVIQKISIGVNQIKERKHRFIVSSGVGFDADVCNEAIESPIKKILNRFGLGKLTYLGIALKQLILLKPVSMTMILDDRRHMEFDRIYFAACMNLRYEGGGFMFCPEAIATDEYLDICIVEKMSKLRILTLLPTCFHGKHINYKGVHIYRCKTASFITKSPLQVHTDGEGAGVATKINMYLEPEQVNMIIA